MNKKKTITACAGIFVAGVLTGSLITGLVIKQPWVKKTKEKKESTSVPGREYDVQKCVTLGDYDGIKVSLAVSQEDIDSEIENLQEEYTTYEKKKGKIQDGDQVYADYEGYIDGKRVDDTCGSDYIEIGGDEWLPGFAEKLVGAETGKQVKFKINVPEGTYGDDSIDGKQVTFQVTVQYICGEAIVPEYNDDFVKSISEYKTVKEYNAHLKKQLLEENEADKAEYAWTDVLDGCKVKRYPEDLMEDAKQEVLQGYYDMADLYSMSHDEIFTSFGRKDEQDFVDHDLDELAKDTVKEVLVTEAIAQKEGINYSDKDYESVVEEEYSYNTDSYGSKAEYEKKNRTYLKRLSLTKAVKEWISDHASFLKE